VKCVIKNMNFTNRFLTPIKDLCKCFAGGIWKGVLCKEGKMCLNWGIRMVVNVQMELLRNQWLYFKYLFVYLFIYLFSMHTLWCTLNKIFNVREMVIYILNFIPDVYFLNVKMFIKYTRINFCESDFADRFQT